MDLSSGPNRIPKPVVYIVDDDEAVVDAISLLLESVDIDSTAYFDAVSFLKDYTELNFDKKVGCIILDIRMPVISGVECQHRLQSRDSHLPIIFVTGHGDVPMAVAAMKNGAFEFIQKPFRDQELIETVQQAVLLSQGLYRANLLSADIRSRLELLTERERKILAAIVDGKSNKQIALELYLSQRTVEIHRAHIMEKMQAKSLASLIKMALDADSN